MRRGASGDAPRCEFLMALKQWFTIMRDDKSLSSVENNEGQWDGEQEER